MNSELKARLERLGPVRAISHDRSFSDELVTVILRRDPVPFRTAVSVARRLFASGMSLRAAHVAINELAADGRALCEIPIDGGIDELARDLPALNVHLHRLRNVANPGAFIAAVRDRHGLSQRAFAAALGIDVRTLQNWEQGRNRPDSTVLSLVTLYDRDPRMVEDAVFEPVP
jgi:DNA-binding transcriptional regulator YiaG